MKYAILIIAVLLTSCTVNKKYVEIKVQDGTLTVQGNVDPKFMRENTSESQTNTPTISPTIDIKPLECAGCHNAYAGELFNTKLKEIVDDALKDKDEEKPTPIPAPAPTPEPAPQPAPKPPVIEPTPAPKQPVVEPTPGPVPPINLNTVTWLHSNVSSWKVTSTLKSVRITASHIVLDYDKTNVWPGKTHVGANVNANPWIFVYRNNRWYAATFEWMRVGQTAKGINSVNGDHIKKSPLHDFKPIAGETYGFMVSGLARDATRNVQERTNIVMVKWPSISMGY